MPELVIDGREIEIHLPGEFGLEVLDLEFDHHETAQPQMIEEKIEIVVLVGDLEMILAADEREALAKLEDQCAQMLDQSLLQVALQHLRPQRQEIEAVRVFENLLSELGLSRRKCPSEIREGIALAGEQAAFDLMDKDVAAPTVFDRLARVPSTLWRGLYGVEQADVMAPRQ